MSAIMVVYMDITDPSWVGPYFAAVPAILEKYGAVSVAGGRDIRSIEGALPPPGRVAVLSFPSLAAIDAFMSDADYQPYRLARERGAQSEIFVFENNVTSGELV